MKMVQWSLAQSTGKGVERKAVSKLENPTKMDDLWGYPFFRKPPYVRIWLNVSVANSCFRSFRIPLSLFLGLPHCLVSAVSINAGYGERRPAPQRHRHSMQQCSSSDLFFCAEYVRFAQRRWHVEKTTRSWRPQCEKTSPTFEVKTQLAFVEWSPDGKNILFCTLNGEARRMGFWRLMYARMTKFLVSSRVAFDTCRSFQSQFCAANWNFPTTSRAFRFARS